MNATEGVGSGGACSSASSSARTKRLPRTPSTSRVTSAPSSTSSSRSSLRPVRSGVDFGGAMRSNVPPAPPAPSRPRSEEHTSELQSPCNLVCRLLLEKKKKTKVMVDELEARTRKDYV